MVVDMVMLSSSGSLPSSPVETPPISLGRLCLSRSVESMVRSACGAPSVERARCRCRRSARQPPHLHLGPRQSCLAGVRASNEPVERRSTLMALWSTLPQTIMEAEQTADPPCRGTLCLWGACVPLPKSPWIDHLLSTSIVSGRVCDIQQA